MEAANLYMKLVQPELAYVSSGFYYIANAIKVVLPKA